MAITWESTSFDKSSYVPGETVTCTVQYTSTDTQADPGAGTNTCTLSITVTDAEGTATLSGPAGVFDFHETVPSTEPQPTTVAATDTGSHTWAVTSNTLESFNAATGESTWTAVLTTTLPLD